MNTENNINPNNKQFCIWCGSEIKPDSNFCPKCGKKQTEEENQLIDWLIAHTKDKLKGDAESSLFNAIKNFILSHLYGTVMSIAIVAAVGTTVYASEPYIKKIDNTATIDTDFSIAFNSSDELARTFGEYISAIYLGNNPDQYLYHIDVPDDVRLSHDMQTFIKDKHIDTVRITNVQSERNPDHGVLVYNTESLVEGLDVSEGLLDLQITYDDGSKSESTYDFVVVHKNNKIYIVCETQLSSIGVTDSPAPTVKPIDTDAIKLLVEDYVDAIYSGSDLSDIVFQLPTSINYEHINGIYTLIDEYPVHYGYTVRVTTTHYGSAYSPASELKKMGYTVLGANVVVKLNVSETNTRQSFETSNNFTFVEIDGQYKVVDSIVQSKTFSA